MINLHSGLDSNHHIWQECSPSRYRNQALLQVSRNPRIWRPVPRQKIESVTSIPNIVDLKSNVIWKSQAIDMIGKENTYAQGHVGRKPAKHQTNKVPLWFRFEEGPVSRARQQQL